MIRLSPTHTPTFFLAGILTSLLLLAAGCDTPRGPSTRSFGKTLAFDPSDLTVSQEGTCRAFRNRSKIGNPAPWKEDLAFLPFGFTGERGIRITIDRNDLLSLLGPPDHSLNLLDGSTQLNYKIGALRHSGNTYDIMMNVFHNADQTARAQFYTTQDQQY